LAPIQGTNPCDSIFLNKRQALFGPWLIKSVLVKESMVVWEKLSQQCLRVHTLDGGSAPKAIKWSRSILVANSMKKIVDVLDKLYYTVGNIPAEPLNNAQLSGFSFFQHEFIR
jgi:hypothetical protein